MIKGSTLLRVFTLILIVIYSIRYFNTSKTSNVSNLLANDQLGSSYPELQKRSIPKILSDKISEKLVIPRYYSELDKLAGSFSSSLDKGSPKWEHLIKIGDIYSTGVFPFLRPDDICAQQCYTVIAKCPCPEAAAIGLSKLVNSRTNPVERVDRQGEAINPAYSNVLTKQTNKYINKLPDSSFKKNKNRYDNKKIVLPVHKPKKKNTTRRTQGSAQPRPRPRPTHDKQNVHDHGVSSAIKTNIERLRKEFEATEHLKPDEIVSKAVAICNEIQQGSKKDKNVTFSKNDLSDAHNVIVSLTPDQYSNTGLTQIQILGRVLQKIEDIGKKDPSVAQGVKETLCKRLSSGVENGSTVCATGKISRALSVFEGVLEDSQKAVSMDVIRQELGTLAQKTRTEYLETVGPEGRRAYDTAGSVSSYSKKMKDIFMSSVHKTYIQDLGMNENILNPIASVYADVF